MRFQIETFGVRWEFGITALSSIHRTSAPDERWQSLTMRHLDLDTLRVCLPTPFKAKSVIIEGTTWAPVKLKLSLLIDSLGSPQNSANQALLHGRISGLLWAYRRKIVEVRRLKAVLSDEWNAIEQAGRNAVYICTNLKTRSSYQNKNGNSTSLWDARGRMRCRWECARGWIRMTIWMTIWMFVDDLDTQVDALGLY